MGLQAAGRGPSAQSGGRPRRPSCVPLTLLAMSIAKLTPIFKTGAWLITFVTLGKYLEAYGRGETAGVLRTLMKLQPVLVTLAVLPQEVVVELDRIDRTTMT